VAVKKRTGIDTRPKEIVALRSGLSAIEVLLAHHVAFVIPRSFVRKLLK